MSIKNNKGLLAEVIKTIAQKYLNEIEWKLRKIILLKKLNNIINIL